MVAIFEDLQFLQHFIQKNNNFCHLPVQNKEKNDDCITPLHNFPGGNNSRLCEVQIICNFDKFITGRSCSLQTGDAGNFRAVEELSDLQLAR